MSDPENKKSIIFRQQTVDRLSSPEQLDRLMQIVSPKDWLPLALLFAFGGLGLLWSIFGRIPITATAKGVLINPRGVLPLQSSISGQLQSLKIENGQCVNRGEIIAIVDPSAKKQQLQQQRDKLVQLNQQIQNTTSLREQATNLEIKAIAAERANLRQQLLDIQQLTPRIKDEELKSILRQRLSFQQKLEDAEELTPILQQRLAKQKELQKRGAISEERILQAEQEYRQARQNISEFQAQLQQLRVQEAELQRKYLENLNSITQIKAELENSYSRSKQLEQDNLGASNTEKNQIQEIEQAIARLEKEITDNSIIKSPHTGCIIEITATVGQYLDPGTGLGIIQTTAATSALIGVNYFSVADGKKIQPGMKVLITPDTVKRTRYGGIVGEITTVSPFPVTAESMTSVVGNPELVQNLLGQAEGQIEAIAELTQNSKTSSGYKWSSSKGPKLKISPGTTATVRVTVEERSPITFVLPILREWSGVD